jgi:hypothetical protein
MTTNLPASTTNSDAVLQKLRGLGGSVALTESKVKSVTALEFEHQHNRYSPPAAVMAEEPQVAIEPLAVTAATKPASAKRCRVEATPHVSRTSTLSARDRPVPRRPPTEQV